MDKRILHIIKSFFLIVFLSISYVANSHSVQVSYCANCNGDLRIWVEHWHSSEDINSTTMTLEVSVNGTTTSYTGSPNVGILNTEFGDLPGCSTPLMVFAACPNTANTYNDWVAYDFPNMPTGVPIIITIISGNNAFTDDGCGMYPASTGVIVIDPPPAVSDVVACSGTNQPVGPFAFAQGNTWTNNNTSIGLAASGTGDIPAFVPTPSSTTQVATITVSNTCETSSFNITVSPGAIPNFTAPGIPGNSGAVCPGQPITFSNLSTPAPGGTITSSTWDFGDGSPPVTAQNPTHTFPTSQTAYNVTLTLNDPSGCLPDTSLTINIEGPDAQFTFANACDGQAVVFTDVSPTAPTNCYWDFNNDGTVDATTQNPSFVYPGPGTYQAKLRIESAGGCSDSIIQSVVVNPKPIAAFSTFNNCFGVTSVFTNNSSIATGTITQWNWAFGDNSPVSALQNPTYTYATHGTYSVLLTATSDSGCVDTASQIISIFDAPNAAFTFINVCSYDSALFTNTSTNPTMGTIASSIWSFGDSSPTNTQTSPSHLYSTAGNYTVTLITQSSNLGCADTISQSIITYPIPVANFTFADVCLSDFATFSDVSSISSGSITSHLWNFGDFSTPSTVANPNHQYALPDSYNVTLIVESNNGCSDTLMETIIIHPLPAVNYTVEDVCFEENVIFTNTSTIVSSDTIQQYIWQMGDNSPLQSTQNTSHNYATAGTYTTELIVVSTFGCSDSLSKVVVVNPKPTAYFTSNNHCNGITTSFIDASTTASGTITNWNWNFGDNSTLNTTQSPSHLYATAGVKNVTLIVNNSFGCADTITKNTTVYFNPIASFTYSNVCSGDTMYFTNNSTVDTSAQITGYLWGFGDAGPNSFDTNPAHYYETPGNYTVTLVTTTADGCSSAAIVPVNAFAAPASLFTVNDGCQANAFNFNNTSIPPTGATIANWSWNFGDGSSLNTTTTSPIHNYSNAGVYQVTLITYSSNLGCSDTLHDSVTVYSSPNAAFSYYEVCANTPMNFTDLSTVGAGATINAWTWNFESGVVMSGIQHPNYNFTNSGSLPVKLIVTTANNCVDSVTQMVLVHPNPVANFTAPNTCLGDLTVFTDLSTIQNNPNNDVIQSRAWDFGDGSPVFNNANTSRMYADTGTYTVQLLIASSFGCLDSVTKQLTIHPNPIVEFTSSDTLGCEPLCINFEQMASISKGNNVAYLWNWGDNTAIDTAIAPTHCFGNNTDTSIVYYPISLTVVSDSGCATVLTKNNYIGVQPKPQINFSVTPSQTSIATSTVEINDATIGATLWNWTFGDGATHNDTLFVSDSLFHTYADTGSYAVTLIATSSLGCSDTAYQGVYISPDVTIYIPNGFSPNGDGKNEIFIPVGIAIKTMEMSIYNRWGNFVFYSDDIDKGWNGKSIDGTELAQQDIYVYVIKIVDDNNKKHYFRGGITLVR